MLDLNVSVILGEYAYDLFEGKLTEKWRIKNINILQKETLSLAQISQELEIIMRNPSHVFGTLHKNDLFKIPSEWIWTRLVNVAQIGQGGTPSTKNKEFWNGSIPWLRSGSVRNNFIKQADSFITKIGLRKSSTTLCPQGTVLLAMTGQGLTRGRCAVLDIDACMNQSIAHMILRSEYIFNKFLFYYLQSQYWKIRGVSKGSNQPGLNVSLIKQFEIPLPPISEQKRIAFKIESIFAKIDAIEKYVESTLDLLDNLKSSTLKTAFAGRLVPQDPSDEPAEVLLQRIKNQKQSKPSEPRSVRRNKNVK